MKTYIFILTIFFSWTKLFAMKAFIVTILSVLLLVSCSPVNLWQKAGLASPEPITIKGKTGSAGLTDEEKVDVVRSFVGDRDSYITFSIDKPSSFTGSVLYPQRKEEAEAMAQMLNAKCYNKDSVKKFLASEIEDEELVMSMKNTVSLLEAGKSTIIEGIVGFLPDFPITEETDETLKSIIEYYNSIKKNISDYCDDMVSAMFDPLTDLLASSDAPTWGEYVKCQLMINVFSGVLGSMDAIVDGVMNTLTSEEFTDAVFDLSEKEKQVKLSSQLMKVGVSALLDIANGVVSSVISPLAVYNSISYSYGEDIGLMPITDIINQMLGE